MQKSDRERIVAQIHATPHRLVLEFAGAGSLALWWLHSVAGSSRTILEATDRYAAASMQALLGQQPEQFVAVETAAAMARHAYRRACVLVGADHVLGVACTATIATNRTKRGEHQCAIAVQGSDAMTTWYLRLTKGLRDRLAEETIVGQMLINAIAQACGVAPTIALDLAEHERIETSCSTDAIQRLLNHEVHHVVCTADGHYMTDQPFTGALLSGSFNPLHEGHQRLVAAAGELLGLSVAFEIAVVHPDKGQLALEEVTHRLSQFLTGRHIAILSRASLYSDKARQFPGCTLIVGYDTAARLLKPHYYGGEMGMHASLETVRANGCRFLVAGRIEQHRFATRDDLDVPAGFDDLFIGLSEEHFRADISSTELREG